MTHRPAVLFVCVHNAGRSQMAAAFLEQLAGGRIEVFSAGSEPADAINPAAIAAMREVMADLASSEIGCSLSSEATLCRLFLVRWWISRISRLLRSTAAARLARIFSSRCSSRITQTDSTPSPAITGSRKRASCSICSRRRAFSMASAAWSLNACATRTSSALNGRASRK